MSNHAAEYVRKILYLQSIINRVNKASLIEEAKIHSIKNYTRIPNKELCIQLWNHKEYVNVSNITRIMTRNKKRSKKEDISQQIVEKPKILKSLKLLHLKILCKMILVHHVKNHMPKKKLK